MLLEPFLTSIASKVVALLVGPRLAAWIEKRSMPRFFRRMMNMRAYRTNLPEKIKRMPFIYAGIEADVLNDFVEIQLNSLNPSTLDAKSVPSSFKLDPWKTLTDRRIVAIVGNAGIGKTTFERHMAIQVLEGQAPFLLSRENPLPIYVALKVVPNNGPNPIFRYVFKEPPFCGDIVHLHSVIKNRGLFLCLDGYDEIALTGTTENYIQQELAQILFGSQQRPKNWQPPGSKPDALQKEFSRGVSSGSRVWLTSRPQFLQHHPIGNLGDLRSEARDLIATIGIVGIGQNREALVDRIFSRYSSTHVDVSSLLHGEFFLQHIDHFQDKEVREMSFNPLFLTVMCYNYAQLVLRAQRHDVALATTFRTLVLQCVDLLLVDLDEYKARQFSSVQKHAIENRRNEFIDEKREFLSFLAAVSYLRKINVFTEDGIKAILLEFLEASEQQSAGRIISSFQASATDRPSFVRQLIFCGVFVLVDSSSSDRYYDFPHRRFREVLAVKHFSKPHAYLEYLIQHAVQGDAALVELSTVLKRAEEIQDADTQTQTLKLLCDRLLARDKSSDFVEVAKSFVALKPGDCELGGVIGNFLRRAIEMRRPDFDTSVCLLRLHAASADDTWRIESYVRERCEEEDAYGVALGCALLAEYSPARGVSFVRGIVQDSQYSPLLTAVLSRSSFSGDERDDVSFISKLMRSNVDRWGVIDAILTTEGVNREAIFSAAWNAVEPGRQICLFLYAANLLEVGVIDQTRWIALTQYVGRRIDSRGLLAVRAESGKPQALENCFFLAHSSITSICSHFESFQRSGLIKEQQVRGLAIRKPEHEDVFGGSFHNENRKFLYASVSDTDVKFFREQLEANLRAFEDSFVTDFESISMQLRITVGALFEAANFLSTRTTVAYAGGDVFLSQDIFHSLEHHTRNQLQAGADLVRETIENWPHVPSPLDRVPRFFK